MTSYARDSPASVRTAAPIITSLVRDGAFCNTFLKGFVFFFLAPIAWGSERRGAGRRSELARPPRSPGAVRVRARRAVGARAYYVFSECWYDLRLASRNAVRTAIGVMIESLRESVPDVPDGRA